MKSRIRHSEVSRLLIRPCRSDESSEILTIINDGASAYRGIIPSDCWHEPYMDAVHLKKELAVGVVFWGAEEDGRLLGVMGLQDMKDVTLIRHAYVRTSHRNRGVGGRLLARLRTLTDRPVLMGTWKAAVWAVRFYEKNGFTMVSEEEKDRLLRKYWDIPDRQVETSCVLADERWRIREGPRT